MPNRGGIDLAPVLDMVGMHTDPSGIETTPTQRSHAKLSLLTEVGRRYPGYPSALSPTANAKQLYPSPDSETGSGLATPRPASPMSISMKSASPASPMSAGSANMQGRYSRLSTDWLPGAEVNKKLECEELLNAGVITDHDIWNNHYQIFNGWTNKVFIAGTDNIGMQPRSSTPNSAHQSLSTASLGSTSPTSPISPMSPRIAMLKNMASKQAFQSLSHQPSASPPSLTHPTCQYPIPSSFYKGPSPPPTIQIANGFETSTASPLTATGMLLSYTSNRSMNSGLLAVKPLSEAQVAEYRFWRPCGRKSCAFGCGGGSEGETRAARRLFRSAEEIGEEGYNCDDNNSEVGEAEREQKMEEEGVSIVVGSDGEEVVEIRV